MIRRLLRNSSLIINLVVIGFLLLSKGACYISPEKFWWVAFIGIAFPVFLLLNLLFLFFWLMAKPVYILFPLLGFGIVWSQVKTFISFSSKNEMIDKNATSIMTYNVKNFDLYNWSKNKETREKVFNLIRTQHPDIICFQEFYSQSAGEFQNQKFIQDSLGYQYSFFSKTHSKPYPKKGKLKFIMNWGTAIFSKFPITDTGKIEFPQILNNNCQWADIATANKTIRVYNTHLQSIHLGYDDYNTLEEIEQTQKTSWAKLKNILRKLKRAYTKRASQVMLIKKSMQNCSKPSILCGDFNDPPVSFTYHQLSRNMQDAFIKKGNGVGGTFVNSLNLFRIDYMLFSESFNIMSYKLM
jgi:endonuclease/exonuclease/phosphatase family metal-dependent hydrolase